MQVPQGTSKWSANFQMKRSKVKVTGCQKSPQKSGVVFINLYGQPIERPLSEDCKKCKSLVCIQTLLYTAVADYSADSLRSLATYASEKLIGYSSRI